MEPDQATVKIGIETLTYILETYAPPLRPLILELTKKGYIQPLLHIEGNQHAFICRIAQSPAEVEAFKAEWEESCHMEQKMTAIHDGAQDDLPHPRPYLPKPKPS